MRRTALCSLLVAALAAVPAAGEIPVDGVVRDNAGQPLAGAEITLVPVRSTWQTGVDDVNGRVGAEPVATTASDGAGRFRVDAPRPGLWQVRVSAAGFVPMAYRLWPLDDEAVLPPVDLRRSRPVVAQVTAPDGRPVAGATVTSRPSERQFWAPQRTRRMPWWPASRRALTGDDGTVSIPRADGEAMEFSAWAPGFAAAGITRPADGRVVLRLSVASAVAVVVTDAAGEAAAHAVVQVGEDRWATGFTGDDGRFTAWVPDDRTVAAVAASGARAAAVAGPGDEPVVLRLAEPRRVSGRVVDANDRSPLADALVWSNGGGDGFATTDRAGGFSVTVTGAEGRRVLQAAAPGYFRQWLQLSDTVELEPVLALEPSAAVAGRVVDSAGEPVAGATVAAHVSPVDRAAMRLAYRQREEAVTDDTGRFRLGGLVPDTPLTLVATRDGFAPARLDQPALAPRETRRGVELELSGGVGLSGVVLGDGEPAAGAELSLEREPQGSTPWAMMAAEAAAAPPLAGSTAADGSFTFANLAEASYRLTVKAPGFAPLVMPGIEVGDSGTALGTLTLERGVEIRGAVVDADGRGLGGAELRVVARQSGFTMGRGYGSAAPPAAVTAADGSFRLADRQRGERVDIQASLEGYASAAASGVPAPNPEEVRIVLEQVATITGEVVGPDGSPVASAQVSAMVEVGSVSGAGAVYFSDQSMAHDRTDEAGRFELGSVPPGKVRVSASAQGWLRAEDRLVDLVPGGGLEDLRLVLRRGATVTGQVSDADGLPADGVMVRVEERPRMMMVSRPAMTVAGGDGRYALEGVEPGLRTILATDDEQRRVTREIDVLPGVNRLDLRFGGGFEISGRVADQTATPLAGARVSLHASSRSWRGSETVAGEDGSFSFTDVAEGDYFLRAGHPGYASHSSSEPLRIAGGSLSGIEIRLQSGSVIRGRILGLEAGELARVELMAATMNRDIAIGRVGHDGDYEIRDVGPGQWQIQAMVDTRQATASVQIDEGATEARVDLEFGAGLTLSGQLLSAGEPLSGLIVMVSGTDVLTHAGSQTDHQGRFRLEGLEPGRLQLTVRDIGSGLQHQEEVQLDADRDVVIELDTGRISGRVFDAGDGSPLAGASVGLVPAGDDSSPLRFAGLDFGRGTDSQGQFVISRAAAGEHSLRVVKDGYAPAQLPVSLLPGQEIAGLEVALEPSQGVQLVVVGPAGTPPAEIQFAVLDAGGSTLTFGSRNADSSGLVRIPSVPAGRFELLVAASATAVSRLAVESPGPPVAVGLAAAGRLELAVAGLAEDRSLAKATLTGPDGRPFLGMAWGGLVQSEWHLVSGRVVIEGLSPGRFKVLVTAPDGRQWQGTAAVSAGQSSRLDL